MHFPHRHPFPRRLQSGRAEAAGTCLPGRNGLRGRSSFPVRSAFHCDGTQVSTNIRERTLACVPFPELPLDGRAVGQQTGPAGGGGTGQLTADPLKLLGGLPPGRRGRRVPGCDPPEAVLLGGGGQPESLSGVQPSVFSQHRNHWERKRDQTPRPFKAPLVMGHAG